MAITLKQAMALNGTPDINSFLELQSSCKNLSYFNEEKPINYLSSWEGYTVPDINIHKFGVGVKATTSDINNIYDILGVLSLYWNLYESESYITILSNYISIDSSEYTKHIGEANMTPDYRLVSNIRVRSIPWPSEGEFTQAEISIQYTYGTHGSQSNSTETQYAYNTDVDLMFHMHPAAELYNITGLYVYIVYS